MILLAPALDHSGLGTNLIDALHASALEEFAACLRRSNHLDQLLLAFTLDVLPDPWQALQQILNESEVAAPLDQTTALSISGSPPATVRDAAGGTMRAQVCQVSCAARTRNPRARNSKLIIKFKIKP